MLENTPAMGSGRAALATVIPGRPGRIAGLDGRRMVARRNRELVNAFTSALGGSVDDATAVKVKRAAELIVAAEQMRAAALRGERVDAMALVRLENLAARSERALGLKPAGRRWMRLGAR